LLFSLSGSKKSKKIKIAKMTISPIIAFIINSVSTAAAFFSYYTQQKINLSKNTLLSKIEFTHRYNRQNREKGK